MTEGTEGGGGGGVVELTTADGNTICAHSVVNATGAWVDSLAAPEGTC